MSNPMLLAALGINTQAMQEDGPGGEPPMNHQQSGVSRALYHSDGTVETRQEGVVRGDTSHLGHDNSGVFTDMRTRTGFPLTMEQLEPQSIVGVPGIGQMELRHAINAGFVVQNANGSYSKNSGQARQPAKQPVHPDLRTEGTDKTTEDAFEIFENRTAMSTQATAIHELASNGEMSANTMNQLASDMGVEPAQMDEFVGTIRQGFERQARSAIAESGVDPDKVLQWAYAERPAQMSESIKRQLSKRNPDGYRSIAKEYLQNLDTIDPDAILNAQLGKGIEARKVKGKVILYTPYGELPWKSAIRSGMIRLG